MVFELYSVQDEVDEAPSIWHASPAAESAEAANHAADDTSPASKHVQPSGLVSDHTNQTPPPFPFQPQMANRDPINPVPTLMFWLQIGSLQFVG